MVEFTSIYEYEKSVYWELTRERYRLSGREWACAVCRRERPQLHHLAYRDLGKESLDDLMPLCEDHHYEVEKHVRRTKGELNRREATFDYLTRTEARAEKGRIRSPHKLNALLAFPQQERSAAA